MTQLPTDVDELQRMVVFLCKEINIPVERWLNIWNAAKELRSLLKAQEENDVSDTNVR